MWHGTIYLYGVKKTGKWLTTVKLNKGQILSTIFVSVYPETYLYPKVRQLIYGYSL